MILVLLLCTKEPKNNYRPQTKFAKVMFSQVFVCQRGGVSVQGLLSFCPGGFCPGGIHPRGLCTGRSLSRRVFVQAGFLSGGLCPRGLCPGGLCPGGSLGAVRILLECILVKNFLAF